MAGIWGADRCFSNRTPVCTPLLRDRYSRIVACRENPVTIEDRGSRACNMRNVRSSRVCGLLLPVTLNPRADGGFAQALGPRAAGEICARPLAGAAGGAGTRDACDPQRGLLELRRRGQLLWALPRQREGLRAAGCHDRVAEAPARLVPL